VVTGFRTERDGDHLRQPVPWSMVIAEAPVGRGDDRERVCHRCPATSSSQRPFDQDTLVLLARQSLIASCGSRTKPLAPWSP